MANNVEKERWIKAIQASIIHWKGDIAFDLLKGRKAYTTNGVNPRWSDGEDIHCGADKCDLCVQAGFDCDICPLRLSSGFECGWQGSAWCDFVKNPTLKNAQKVIACLEKALLYVDRQMMTKRKFLESIDFPAKTKSVCEDESFAAYLTKKEIDDLCDDDDMVHKEEFLKKLFPAAFKKSDPKIKNEYFGSGSLFILKGKQLDKFSHCQPDIKFGLTHTPHPYIDFQVDFNRLFVLCHTGLPMEYRLVNIATGYNYGSGNLVFARTKGRGIRIPDFILKDFDLALAGKIA